MLRVCGALAGKKKRRSGLACLEMQFPFGKKKMDVSVKRDRFVGGATIFYHKGEVAPMAERSFSRGIGHLSAAGKAFVGATTFAKGCDSCVGQRFSGGKRRT